MITYPVSPDSRWSVLQLSTGEIIARNLAWPRADGLAIVGGDPDHVWLLQSAATPPEYDSRLYSLQTTETVDAEANEIRRTHKALKRPIDERKVAAENTEVSEFSKHISIEREVIETRLMLAAVLQYIDGLVMPPKVKEMADEYKAKGVVLWKNRDRVKAIIAAIEADDDPDLDSGWEPEP